MKLSKMQILMTGLLMLALGLLAFTDVPREDIVYCAQFLILSLGLFSVQKSMALRISLAALLCADFLYYILVYKLHFGTADKFVVILSSFSYFLSFNLFSYILLRSNLRKFIKTTTHWCQQPAIFFFLGVAGYYILFPGINKLLAEGLSFGHLSNLITLTSSLPLAIVSYTFLTNSAPGKPLGPVIGFFVLGVLDIGIQLETIKYGDLKFSLYDIIWFFGVYFISFCAKDFSLDTPAIIEKRSIDNIVKKTFFLSALFPMVAIYFITIDLFNFSPMYFIFVLVSIFLFGVAVSAIINQRINHYSRAMKAILANDPNVNLDSLIKSTPVEFQESLTAVYNKVIEKDVTELSSQKSQLSEIKNSYRKMAHDLASPLSVLEILSQTENSLEEERKSLLIQATQRVRKISQDILVRERETSYQNNRNLEVLNSGSLHQAIRNLIREKKVEYKNHPSPFTIEFDSHLQEPLKVLASEEDLMRVISNLINNSVEAMSGADGMIQISLTERAEHIEIQIQDNGPGFPQAILESGPAPSLTLSKPQGQGIGLFNAAKTLQRWNGRLELKNESGAVVKMTLRKCEGYSSVASVTTRSIPLLPLS